MKNKLGFDGLECDKDGLLKEERGVWIFSIKDKRLKSDDKAKGKPKPKYRKRPKA